MVFAFSCPHLRLELPPQSLSYSDTLRPRETNGNSRGGVKMVKVEIEETQKSCTHVRKCHVRDLSKSANLIYFPIPLGVGSRPSNPLRTRAQRWALNPSSGDWGQPAPRTTVSSSPRFEPERYPFKRLKCPFLCQRPLNGRCDTHQESFHVD